MDFGKLLSVDRVNFTLNPEPPDNLTVLSDIVPPDKPAIYLGATGYNMKPWVGRWYPAGAKEKDFLRYYGSQFNSIEHNTTHYSIPDTVIIAKWREETPADFKFCPKIPQTISHSRDIGINSGQIQQFCAVIQALAPKIGTCFLQLPPYLELKDIAKLVRFFEVWPANIPLSVEVRHESFFNSGADAATYFQLLQENNIIAVITDVAGRRDACHLRLTANKTLIRFVGNGLHPTDYSRIIDWSRVLKRWTDYGLQEVYFFTHEPDNLLAPDLAQFCETTFSAAMPTVSIRGPRAMIQSVQGTLF